jgi:hypothetical protein
MYLNRTLDGGVVAFPMKYYGPADEPNVVLWWSSTPRWVLSMVHPHPMSYRGLVRSISKVHSILKLFPKHMESANIR